MSDVTLADAALAAKNLYSNFKNLLKVGEFVSGLADLEGAKADLERSVSRLREEASSAELRVAELAKTEADALARVEALNSKVELQSAEADEEVQRRLDEANASAQRIRAEADKYAVDLRAAREAKIAFLDSELVELQKRIAIAEAKLTEAREARAKLLSTLGE